MRKLELARAMAADPKLLIADEAMAGLSQSEVTDIVDLLIKLNERGVTIIMIEHIMRAVMSFSPQCREPRIEAHEDSKGMTRDPPQGLVLCEERNEARK